MGKNPKIKPHQQKSIISESIEKKIKSSSLLINDDFLLLSLRHLDKTQGDVWESWEEKKILSRALHSLAGYCASSLRSQANTKKFTIYGQFPPKNKTAFNHPNHVPEDAEWARIHIIGKQCLIGHVVSNTFYLVFLDGEHKFWISELKNT